MGSQTAEPVGLLDQHHAAGAAGPFEVLDHLTKTGPSGALGGLHGNELSCGLEPSLERIGAEQLQLGRTGELLLGLLLAYEYDVEYALDAAATGRGTADCRQKSSLPAPKARPTPLVLTWHQRSEAADDPPPFTGCAAYGAVLAYNLGNFLRRLALPRERARWSLTALREKLVKIGARLVRHARWLILQMAEVPVTRDPFAQILSRIRRLTPGPT